MESETGDGDVAAATGDAGRKRMAENEVAFRRLNESLDQAVDAVGGEHTQHDFICECGRSDCFDRVKLTRAAYQRVREDGTRFVLVPGHENPKFEHVVDRDPGLILVEKTGVAGRIAESQNPRGNGEEGTGSH